MSADDRSTDKACFSISDEGRLRALAGKGYDIDFPSMLEVLADVRRETVEACAQWVERFGPHHARLMREEMAGPRTGAGGGSDV